MSWLSKHPYDWLIHAVLCCIPIVFDWATWFVVLFVGVVLEFEQKAQVWYDSLTWTEYIGEHAFGDLVADGLGIGLGLYLKSIL